MSVLKSKRKESQFEVFHSYYKMRREITDLLLRDFGYSLDEAKRIIDKKFGNRRYEEFTPEEKIRYNKMREKYIKFYSWFVQDERKAVVDCLRKIGEEIFTANSIYPMYMDELIERRMHQDIAIGQCNRLAQELQYAIETLPVDVNKYLRFSEMIKTEINLIKGWRKSDNKFKGALSDSAANFANVNWNGNADYNNASNANGVRPDFEPMNE